MILDGIWSIPSTVLLIWKTAFSTSSKEQLYYLIGSSFFSSIKLGTSLLLVILLLTNPINKNNFFLVFLVSLNYSLLAIRLLIKLAGLNTILLARATLQLRICCDYLDYQ